MTGKSQRKGKKYSTHKKKNRPSRPTMLAHKPAVAQNREPVSVPDVPVPSARVPTPALKPDIIHYPNITTELRIISILAGLMLLVLIVLALVLS